MLCKHMIKKLIYHVFSLIQISFRNTLAYMAGFEQGGQSQGDLHGTIFAYIYISLHAAALEHTAALIWKDVM